MPPLALHTALAKEIADRLNLAALDDERGSFYLGSTAPDIRVITHWERSRTHFFDLERFDEQSGVSALLEAYPVLTNPDDLSPQTRAFTAGYLTHLVTDETWITTVYRPYFGERSPLGGDIRANKEMALCSSSASSFTRNPAWSPNSEKALRSPPAQNIRPLAEMRTTFTVGSLSQARAARARSAAMRRRLAPRRRESVKK